MSCVKDIDYLALSTRIHAMETRMLNPRKVFTHCRLVTRLTGFQR